MEPRYALGLDFGTNSVRALLADVADGREAATCVWNYRHGARGVILTADPHLARQHPEDYLRGAAATIRGVLAQARRADRAFRPAQVVGIGVDTTGSTPLPVDRDGCPLAFRPGFADDPAALAWLWKDHTAVAEAEEITALARRRRPRYLAACGGVYSSEWFFSKILRAMRASPRVARAAWTWVEIADWIPAALAGRSRPESMRVGVCAAGHKAMYAEEWGGYPDAAFLRRLDPRLGELRARLASRAHAADEPAGSLSAAWARRTGLPEGLPVAVGAFDAHLGAVGAGIRAGRMVQIIGTSACDMMVAPGRRPRPEIPGLCGVVRGSILPGAYGLEAGQSAVGDLYNWFVDVLRPGGARAGSHEALTAAASRLAPGASGLLALDWNNGNRTVLVDQRLTGLLVGQTLRTTPPEIYRALIEATAFGLATIIGRFEDYGLSVREVVNCGGIAEKNPLVMQIYADVTGRAMRVSRSGQTCALGAAMAGAVVAGRRRGGHADFAAAQRAMCGMKKKEYRPDRAAHATYRALQALYRRLHDAFGPPDAAPLGRLMKDLLALRARAAAPRGSRPARP
jgi:L-ribulokinase